MEIILYLKRRTVITTIPLTFRVQKVMKANTDRDGIGDKKGFDMKQIGNELNNPPITVKGREIRKYQHGR